jgi:UDP-N-acetylmuramoyl-tripeptide--D-alanyl-D-alanine ligase
VLAALHLAGADVAAGAATLAEIAAPRGRGRIVRLEIDGEPATLLDEAYNANPASMRAAFAQFAALRPGPGGRRVAVLGDMLELGERAADYHRDLAPDLVATGVAVVHTVGPMMTALREALPSDVRGVHAAIAAELVDAVLDDLRAGDVVVVKGSNGIRMAQIVDSLVERHTALSTGSAG